jgi:hypothetical protein
MSQHDMDLVNAGGAAFRSDANSALAALVSNSSGSTAPSTTFAYQWWADTTTGILKQRNAANSGWISVLTLATGLPLGVTVPNALTGCTMSTAGSSATMSIAAGLVADSTNAAMMTLAAIAKTTSAWTVGTAAGGLDTGTIANSTWYHFYVIRRPDTGVVDALFSLSASAPTLPANYTQFRRIGSAKTNGSAQWTKFVQVGDEFLWDAAVLDVNSTTQSSTAVLYALSVPPSVQVQAFYNALSSDPGTPSLLFTSPDESDQAPSASASPLNSINGISNATGNAGGEYRTRTNTSAQIRVRATAAVAFFRIATRGWVDTRGKNA